MLSVAFEAYVRVRARMQQGVRPGRPLRELMLWQSSLIPDALLSAHGVDGRVAFAVAVCRLEAEVSQARPDLAGDVIALAHGFVRGLLATEAGSLWGGVCAQLRRRRGLLQH